VVLGILNPNALAGGRLIIDRGLAERAIKELVATPLGLSVEDAAHGIRAVANAAMARAIRAVTVERGRDPRDLTLMAFGGNGGIHSVDVARQLGVRTIIIPPLAGVFSAVGMLAADIEHTALVTVMRLLDDLTAQDLSVIMARLSAEVAGRLAADGYGADRTELVWQAELRHEGQATELPVPFSADGDILAEIKERFVEEYLKTYGYRDETPLELVKVTVTGRGLRQSRLDFNAMKIEQRTGAARAGYRLVSFSRGAPAIETAIVSRATISTTERAGPLIVEEFDATIVVPPHATISRDRMGNLVLKIEGSA
jgi:N-methylhydantoinase A